MKKLENPDLENPDLDEPDLDDPDGLVVCLLDRAECEELMVAVETAYAAAVATDAQVGQAWQTWLTEPCADNRALWREAQAANIAHQYALREAHDTLTDAIDMAAHRELQNNPPDDEDVR